MTRMFMSVSKAGATWPPPSLVDRKKANDNDID